MLDDAIDLLPQSKLVKLVGQYLDVAKLRPDGTTKATLLAEVQAFERASLQGEYYDSFNVSRKTSCRHPRGPAHGSPSVAAMDSLWISRPTYSVLAVGTPASS